MANRLPSAEDLFFRDTPPQRGGRRWLHLGIAYLVGVASGVVATLLGRAG